ncbi:uncharacterized protein DFL_009236 [Arthrobotrys flagrans]|uniref:MACPF-like domain-containing protein n=1 Tax=Arthrobotrys flagrans TaxID=97331 RepID=A0A436ZR24_ARTFL|nr:hypothetical protein DFL_009236 [Arthrobotrys flagrans]
MSKVQFHITVQSTDDTIYPSFANTSFESGEPNQISLGMIRSKCRISSKLFFTVDGKARLDDSTTLDYYMSLFSDGQAILKLFKQFQKIEKKESGNGNDTGGQGDKGESEDQPMEDNLDNPSFIEVKTLKVQVTDGKKEKPLISGVDQSAFKEFVEKIAEPTLTPGSLPTLDEKHRQLASLSVNWATNSGKDFTEPADLTEQQWDRILSNNRALHGYYYSANDRTIVKAPKRAFKIRSNHPKPEEPVLAPKNEAKVLKSEAPVAVKSSLPTIPPFYVYDDAEISVTEISHNFQTTMLKEGFSSVAIEANATFGIPVSVSASLAKEQSHANQNRSETMVKSLVAIYSFPRVTVELDSDSLELTDECKADAYRVTDEEGAEKFYQKYGSVLATSFTLGGFLYSTQDVTTEESSNLAQTKNKTRIAAGLSLQSPYGGGGGNFGKTNYDSSTAGNVSLDQEVRLAWSARGGDTILCSNPSAWAATVKDYRLWRLMNQQRFVGVKYLIKDIDTHVYKQLANPKPINMTGEQDIIKNDKYAERLIAGLRTAFRKPEGNVLAQKVTEMYNKHVGNLVDYNKFCNDLDDPRAEISSGTDWNQVSEGKKAIFGLWLYHVNKLERPAV